MIKPNKIKIGNLTYTVKELPPPAPMEVSNKGIILYREQELYLDSGVSHEALRECLLHEILHGILVQGGFEKETDDDKLVCTLSNGIFQVFIDNPELLSFIWEKK